MDGGGWRPHALAAVVVAAVLGAALAVASQPSPEQPTEQQSAKEALIWSLYSPQHRSGAGSPSDSTGPAALTLRNLQQGGLCQTGAPAAPVVELGIAEAHAAMLAGSLNCSALVAAYLQRIAAFDQRTQLNSVRAVNPQAAAVSSSCRRCRCLLPFSRAWPAAACVCVPASPACPAACPAHPS